MGTPPSSDPFFASSSAAWNPMSLSIVANEEVDGRKRTVIIIGNLNGRKGYFCALERAYRARVAFNTRGGMLQIVTTGSARLTYVNSHGCVQVQQCESRIICSDDGTLVPVRQCPERVTVPGAGATERSRMISGYPPTPP